MKKSVQQIMIGTLCKNYKSTLETLKKIKEYGYDGIELNGFMIHPTPFIVHILTSLAGMPVGKGGKLDWGRLLKESNLEVTSLHTDLGSLEKDPLKIIDEAKMFKTKYLVITGMYQYEYSKEEELSKLCTRLNEVGKICYENGISLLYHNHNVEWKRIESNDFAYNYIIEHTNPTYLNFEFDSYWPSEAGVNALSVMKKLGSRMKLYHINDRGNKKKGPFMTPILKSDSMELGTGCMDLNSLISQAKENGVETIVLETHRNFIDHSPLKSIEVSGEYLSKNI